MKKINQSLCGLVIMAVTTNVAVFADRYDGGYGDRSNNMGDPFATNEGDKKSSRNAADDFAQQNNASSSNSYERDYLPLSVSCNKHMDECDIGLYCQYKESLSGDVTHKCTYDQRNDSLRDSSNSARRDRDKAFENCENSPVPSIARNFKTVNGKCINRGKYIQSMFGKISINKKWSVEAEAAARLSHGAALNVSPDGDRRASWSLYE